MKRIYLCLILLALTGSFSAIATQSAMADDLSIYNQDGDRVGRAERESGGEMSIYNRNGERIGRTEDEGNGPGIADIAQTAMAAVGDGLGVADIAQAFTSVVGT